MDAIKELAFVIRILIRFSMVQSASTGKCHNYNHSEGQKAFKSVRVLYWKKGLKLNINQQKCRYILDLQWMIFWGS